MRNVGTGNGAVKDSVEATETPNNVIPFDLSKATELPFNWNAGHLAEVVDQRRKARRGKAILQPLSTVEMEAIDWLWEGYLAKGMQFIVAGDAKVGKGTAVASIVAAITSGGKLPDGTTAPKGSVIWLCAEDNTAQVILPRLIAAGADIRKVFMLRGVWTADGRGQQTFNLKDDLAAMEHAIRAVGDVALVVLDPINAYLGGKIEAKSNAKVRDVLDPVTAMAERTRVCVLSITHEVKGTGYRNRLSRIADSLAFGAVVRGAFAIDKDTDDPDLRRFMHSGGNLGAAPPTLGFRIETKVVDAARKIAPGCAVWEAEPLDITADEAMREAESDRASSSALGDAKDFLGSLLLPGPVPVAMIEAEAASAGISMRTVKRAKAAMGVRSDKDGMTGGWLWVLPGSEGDQKGTTH